ncbi:MAG: hypothetical protein SNJ82_04170, partial [Gemmataceae bacterium]
ASGPSQARLRALELRCVQLEQDYRIVAEIRDSAQREVQHLKEQLLGHHTLQKELLLWRDKYHQLVSTAQQTQREVASRIGERDKARQELQQRTQERDHLIKLLEQRTREQEVLQKQWLAMQTERESLRKQLQLRINERDRLITRCDKLRKGLKALLEEDVPGELNPSDGRE